MSKQVNPIGKSSYIKPCVVALITLASIGLGLSGCANLVRPNYTQTFTELRSGQYSLDPEHAYVHFSVEHLGLSQIVGRFNTVSGVLDFNANNVENMALEGIIESASIDVNNTDLESTLRDAGWFDTNSFPQIVFKSTSVRSTADGNLIIAGDLTAKGITQTIELDARFNGGADNILTGKYTLGFAATTTVRRSDFNMSAFAALVGDEVTIELHGEFQRN